MLPHFVDDRPGHIAFEHGRRTLTGDFAQKGRQVWVTQQVSNLLGCAVGLIKIGCCCRVFFQMDLGFEHCMQPGADLEAIFCQVNGWRHQRLPGQNAILAVRHLQHANRARRSHRPSPDHCVIKGHWFAVCF